MRTMLIVVSVFAVGTMALASGCGKEQAPRDGGTRDASTLTVVNGKCPIMGTAMDRSKVPSSLVVEFEGRKVGFCCSECAPKWKALTDEEKRAKLAAAMGDGGTPPDSHPGHSH